MAALEAGTVIAGRYVLEHPLGEGGMGTVWAATHQITGGRVALKFVRQGSDPNGEARRRFIREARAAASVEHPNAVGVRDVLEHEETPVIVMDLLQGETLAARMQRVGPLPIAEAVQILLPVISAVGAAHAVGLIHRDLKPENIFLSQTPTGEMVRVLDFGIAKSTRIEEALSSITESGAVVGTPAYMAPEQLLGEKGLDHRVDVWAIGAILYETLVGKRPIEGENYGQLVKELLSGVIPRVDKNKPEVPADVVELVAHMLKRDRSERLSDLREAADVLSGHGVVPRPSFGAPAKKNPESARVVVGAKADPGAATLQDTPAPQRPSGTVAAVAKTANLPTNPSPLRWVALVLVLVAAGVGARAVWSSKQPTNTAAPSAAASSAPPAVSTVASVAPSLVPSVALPMPTPPVVSASTSAALAPTQAPPVVGTKVAIAPVVPSTTASTPAPAPSPTPSAPANPTTTSAPSSSGGLVTKPPF
ncbi:MAG: serine/threonine protein kinase [Myxococcales bacterium]|nr:serine/threonine protein kinase [Myxococcales bacterium]